jgi:hypothetical protein
MIFSSFVLNKTSKLVPERLLGRLADADFLQQIGKNLQTCMRHMTELALVKFPNGLVHGSQKAESLRRNARFHDATVIGLAFTGNQAAPFEAVEEASHVWVVRDHTVTDAAAGQTFGFSAAKDAKDVVLGASEAGGLEELFGFLAEGVGGYEESDEDAVLQGETGTGGFGA